MIPRKPVRESTLDTTYQPISIDRDHVDNIYSPPTSASASLPNVDGKRESDNFTIMEDSSKPPLNHLTEKSNSWRTRLVGIGRSTTVHETEVKSNLSDTANEPIVDRETHFRPLDGKEQRELSRHFHPPTQLLHLLIGGFLKWIVTVIMSALMVSIMWVYSSKKQTLTDKAKSNYNFLIIGLSLALGMNIASSLKAMAVDFRWWVLSLKKRPLKEVDLILRLESLTSVTKLAFVAPRLAPVCFAWILLNLAGQIGIAMLGLTYSPDSVTDKALISYGNVSIPNISDIFSETHLVSGIITSDTLADKQYTANNFGNVALSFNGNDTNHVPDPDTLQTPSSPIIFVDVVNEAYLQYVFMDTNYDILQKTLNTQSNELPPTVFTNRSINTTWSCNSWAVISGGNGNTTNLTILLDSSGNKQAVTLPEAPDLDHTIFITNTTDAGCGPGCETIKAFEAQATEAWWYECNVTVSDVGNATLPEHQIGSSLKKLAAQGIALQGDVRNAAQASSGIQYQIYPATAIYGAPSGGVAASKGLFIGYFTIGTIAAAASVNPSVRVLGGVPETGSQLTVKWRYVAIILALTAFIQLVLFVVSAAVANLVIVKDESHFSTARLLRPIIDRLGPGGTYAEGKEIIQLLGDEETHNVVYSVKHPETGTLHHLDLGHEKRLRAFPRGDYD